MLFIICSEDNTVNDSKKSVNEKIIFILNKLNIENTKENIKKYKKYLVNDLILNQVIENNLNVINDIVESMETGKVIINTKKLTASNIKLIIDIAYSRSNSHDLVIKVCQDNYVISSKYHTLFNEEILKQLHLNNQVIRWIENIYCKKFPKLKQYRDLIIKAEKLGEELSIYKKNNEMYVQSKINEFIDECKTIFLGDYHLLSSYPILKALSKIDYNASIDLMIRIYGVERKASLGEEQMASISIIFHKIQERLKTLKTTDLLFSDSISDYIEQFIARDIYDHLNKMSLSRIQDPEIYNHIVRLKYNIDTIIVDVFKAYLKSEAALKSNQELSAYISEIDKLAKSFSFSRNPQIQEIIKQESTIMINEIIKSSLGQ